MPYNTRRKSLSLPSLGIHVPSSSRRSKVSNPTTGSPSPAPTTSNLSSSSSAHLLPPNKKLKRSDATAPPHPSSTSTTATTRFPIPNGDASIANVKLRRTYGEYTTPPPSPGPESICDERGRQGQAISQGDYRSSGEDAISHTNATNGPSSSLNNVDRAVINDDIVSAVIEQLERTGNRPHLIKELATALACKNETIANSANAAALLSSRLSLFLKRSWSCKHPCPIEKQLIPVHPRKVFFYLTTCPQLMTIEESHKSMFNGQQIQLSQGQEPQIQEEDDSRSTMHNDNFDFQPQLRQTNPPVSAPSSTANGARNGRRMSVSFDNERERSRYSPSPEVGFNLDLSDPMFDEDDEDSDDNTNTVTRDSNNDARDDTYSRRTSSRRLRFPSTSRFSDLVPHQPTPSSQTSNRASSLSRGVASSAIGGRSSSSGSNTRGVRQLSQEHHDRAMSPLLEGDEEEFTQVATAVRERATTTGSPQAAPDSQSRPSLGQLESGAPGTDPTGIDNDIGFIMDGFPVSPTEVDVLAANRRLLASSTSAHEKSPEESRAGASGLVTSPSPSLSGSVASATDDSEVSTVTSPMETDTEGERDRDGVSRRKCVDSGSHLMKREPREEPREEHGSSTPLKTRGGSSSSGTKRPFSNTGSRGLLSMISPSRPGSAPLSMHMFCAGTSFDMGMEEGWKDLKSPENVDVDELDAYFNEAS